MKNTSVELVSEQNQLSIQWDRVANALGGRDVLLRILFILLFCLILTAASSTFLTPGNLLNVFRQAALLFLIASGLTLVLISGGIDLSIGANLGLSACLSALVLKATGSIALAIVAGVSAGAAVGLLNGIVIAYVRIPPFVATYGMLWVLTGITYFVMGGEAISDFPSEFRYLGSGYLLGIPVPVYLMVVFLIGGGFFLQRTIYGQELYTIGANHTAAYLSGIPVRSRHVLVYTVSGAMAGLAAVVFLARINSAEGDIGETVLLPAITAVLIGGTSLFGGIGTLTGTLLGALIITIVINAMNLLSVHTNWQPLVTGLIVVLAVLVDRFAHRR